MLGFSSVNYLESADDLFLKPQQRLHALRTAVIHHLARGNFKFGCMNKCDIIIRHGVKKWIELPLDLPSVLNHASVSISGLGVSYLRNLCQQARMERLSNLQLPNCG